MSIYEKYGFYQEGLQALTLKGKEGSQQIEEILASFRSEPLRVLGNLKITSVEDYLTSIRVQAGKEETIHLPKSNVLKYSFEDGSWICLRPSGTEPKIKFYFGVNSNSMKESKEKLSQVENSFMELVNQKLQK
jgi:phosphoglucomutase